MHHLIGIDEAGYGPNLGPFVMTSVACSVPDECAGVDLWDLLAPVVRRRRDPRDDRLLVDDSKAVYGSTTGLTALETGVLAVLPDRANDDALSLGRLLARIAPTSLEELANECWYHGTTPLPLDAKRDAILSSAEQFVDVGREKGVSWAGVRTVVVCPARFNVITSQCQSKGGVLAQCLIDLLRHNRESLRSDAASSFFVDKHGGRNGYGSMLQDAFPDRFVMTLEESSQRSRYRIAGAAPETTVTIQPRADAEHLCVALASMVSKYLRELLMRELNEHWRRFVPDLKPTAGYPVDAARFLEQIRPEIARQGMELSHVWRNR